jgi:hypothetical protein
MNKTIKKSSEQETKKLRVSLTIDNVTIIKQNLQENGDFYGMHYVFPNGFNYEKLVEWKNKNEIQITNFRKERK